MDKNTIKKYAVWARRELISRVGQKAYQYGIRENGIIDANADSIDGRILTDSEKKERRALVAQIKEKGFEQVMEEVAYTWFNRFCALRFMEVNGYLPTHVRVFTDEGNNFKPQIITEAIHMELDGIDMDKIYALKEANNNDELFKYLLITQCNALNEILPGMFQKIEDYTELLFPDNLLREGSAIEQMITLIPEDDWKDAVQIIGWLYQHYNSEPKDMVFANLKKNIKITKENIPAATQLFTPDWIVRYMVENSLGRLWLEGHPNDELKSKWDYYLDAAEQEADVQEQLDKIREEYKMIKPEEIRVIDPCMGSGHILVYTFDVLMHIYEAYGFNQRDAAKSIVENNIFGLDIDERAAQLAYFAVMMKARQYDRRFFSHKVQPRVYAICESNHLDPFIVEYFANGDDELRADMQKLIADLHDAKEYGSILNVSNVDFDAIYARFHKIKNEASIYAELVFGELLPFVQVAQTMAREYEIVITNPPYMGTNSMNSRLSTFVKDNYSDTKADMSTVFMEKALTMCKPLGYVSMINIPVWMFISSFDKLREKIVKDNSISTMLHLGRGIFGADFGTTAFVIWKKRIRNYIANYRRLFKKQGAVDSIEQKEKWFFDGLGEFHSTQENYEKIPHIPIAYWITQETANTFVNNSKLGDYVDARIGMVSGDNNRFLRLWEEVDFSKIEFCAKPMAEYRSNKKWFPLQKGGDYRLWYGNLNYVINWENDGYELKFENFMGKRIRSHNYNGEQQFKEGITWNSVTSSKFSCRYSPSGFTYNVAGPLCEVVNRNNLYYVLGMLSSKVANYYFSFTNPTINFPSGYLEALPLIISSQYKNRVEELVQKNIKISKEDWDSYEGSYDFTIHPLIKFNRKGSIEEAFSLWSVHRNACFNSLKKNEEELNEIFISVYGLEGQLSSEVDVDDVTVTLAERKKDIKSLISYAVGCMFGRYSLDLEGIAYAGGKWDISKYSSYPADVDNIIPICDDEYFDDDIVGCFVKFIETVYGLRFLEENLKFIANTLGVTGTSREVIRKYFLNDFYNDHCSAHSITGSGKRPIYWMFDSGKKNGFKALIYMHRYQPDTIARMRTDYVHEQQERYRTAITHLEERTNNAPTSERLKLNKQLGKLKDQATEIRVYEEKMHHLADQMIHIDLDDGVKKNYEVFKDVLAEIK